MGAYHHESLVRSQEGVDDLLVHDAGLETLSGVAGELVNDYTPKNQMVVPDAEKGPYGSASEPAAEIMVDGDIALMVENQIERDGRGHEEVHYFQRQYLAQSYKGPVHERSSVRPPLPLDFFCFHS